VSQCHGGADRTITKMISLAHNWPYMRQKRSYAKCPCCQKMDDVRIPKHVHHYVCGLEGRRRKEGKSWLVLQGAEEIVIYSAKVN
jgi:hypothetical protein